jgi:hypothetical protein
VQTAIAEDRKSVETVTLTDPARAHSWVEANHGRRNVYFHLNPTTRPLTRRAERTDVAALAWLHVDVDPRAGEDLAQEQEGALRRLRNPPDGVPKPTAIVFSGGGYQAYWKLRDPFEIGGDPERAEEAKLWNLQLEDVFGADHWAALGACADGTRHASCCSPAV